MQMADACSWADSSSSTFQLLSMQVSADTQWQGYEFHILPVGFKLSEFNFDSVWVQNYNLLSQKKNWEVQDAILGGSNLNLIKLEYGNS